MASEISTSYSSSARSVMGGLYRKKGSSGSNSPSDHHHISVNSSKPSISSVGGFYVSLMENAKTSSQAPSSTRPKQQHERIKASSIGPCPKDSLATLDATGMALQSAQALSTFGVDRGDVDGIVAVMRANPQDDPTQVVCVQELLYVLRHDPSDFTLHKLMTHDIITFLLKLVREFRFHAVLLTDIMHVMMLLAKLAVEHAEVLVRESAGALIAKTMALHPTEDRLQQYTTSLLQTLRTTAVPTGRVAGKPAGFEIAFFNNEYAASNRPATTTLWTPVTGEGSCHKHRASPLEPFQLVSAKSQALAERSRTPELSHSKLRRVLSSPKVPTLTAHNTTLLTNASSGTQQHTMENEENELVAATPLLLRPESCPTFDQLTIDLATTGATPKPWSSQSSLRRKPATSVKRLAPMLVTTPTLGAYRSSPLFVEPLDTAKRVDALHGRMMSTRGPCRPSITTTNSTSPLYPNPIEPTTPPQPSLSSPNNNNHTIGETKPKDFITKAKVNPESLRDHRAAKCLQRYFRRILKTSVHHQAAAALVILTTPDDDELLHDQLGQRDQDEYVLRTIQASFCRGLHVHSQHNYDAAREAYESALESKTCVSFASVVVNVGATYLSQGEYLKALEAFEIAQKMHPHHPKAMYNAGLAHWHLGHPQLAATKFTAVLAADPSHAKAIYALHVLHTQFHVSVS
ncbi:hypothetical protein, variant 1 [Aphanomyces astaci]|uniref:Uncharacterized protein n=2 Tax=Aphanomyces astaci TaxID=112090 RepID=W4FBZ7_APHAT|nr:hypothetical protein, variant 1 [Aphanomyces astaci]ETV64995.1 hypothetical protein, variant 1 [Aphanomyces astaci]|eukprot:XP_009845522.1 hypothetical protein, variant 1 [Aphanomyces astaci]